MKKISIKIIQTFILIFLVNILFGCKNSDVLAIEVHNLDNKVFELGEEISFEDAYITIVYKNGKTEDVELTGEYVDATDLYNAFTSTGEKEITVFYKDNNGNTHYDDVTIIVVNNQTKLEYINELNNYKNDVIYNETAKVLVNNIKSNYTIMIKNANKEDALVLLSIAKLEIDKINTKAEEDNLITINDLSNEIEEIKVKLNSLINYEDSTIKTEIDALKEKINTLKKDLENTEINNEISNIKLSINALEASVNNIKENVEKNNKLILSLTETINNYLVNFVTKEELESKLNSLKETYQTEIELALNEQKMIVEIRVKDGYIEYRYNNSNVFERLLDVSSLSFDDIEDLSIEDNGTVEVRLRNGQAIQTNIKFENNINDITLEKINLEQESIVSLIEEYFDMYYNISNYDYNYIKDTLGLYYEGFTEYAEYTHYDDLEKVKVLLDTLGNYLETEFNVSDNSFAKVMNIEKELKELDTNLSICKAYFATLLTTANMDSYRTEAYVNRILTTSSINSVITLYEEAIKLF